MYLYPFVRITILMFSISNINIYDSAFIHTISLTLSDNVNHTHFIDIN